MRGRLPSGVAGQIIVLRARGPFHHKMAGNIFQFLGDIFTQLLERATTSTAAIARRQDFFLTFQMIGQRCAIVGAFGRSLLISLRLGGCLCASEAAAISVSS